MQGVYLTLINYPPEEWSYLIRPGVSVVGRSKHCDVRLPSLFASVSRRHAELVATATQVAIRDLGSMAGTRVNGVWIDKGRQVRVAVGDRIWMGGVEIDVVAEVSHLARVMAEIGGFEDEPETHVEGKNSRSRTRQMLERLTPAELDVMLWMCRGHTSDEDLGQALGRSPHTVRTQVGHVFEKLGLHSRAEVASWLQRSNRPPAEESPTADSTRRNRDTDHEGFRVRPR